jgi:hypothetical protein
MIRFVVDRLTERASDWWESQRSQTSFETRGDSIKAALSRPVGWRDDGFTNSHRDN